ncbi:MAG: M20 family metallopeptidase [Acidimicrobiia bacterium]
MSPDALKASIASQISAGAEELFDLSHEIHRNPELAFHEEAGARLVADALEDPATTVEVGGYDLPTSVDARSGGGGLVVALVAEYDALPGLGHACGHNIIAAAAVGAFRALRPHLDQLDLELRLVGTPAEEGGGGKILLLERGGFDNVDAALMVHPGPVDLPYMPSLATTRFDVTFRGAAAHASAFPEHGINAADAAVISQVAIGLLRQQLTADQRVHGIVIDGGDAPNVIPDRVRLDYMIRAADIEGLEALERKLRGCFDAGAIGTGATLEFERSMPIYAALEPDPILTDAYVSNAAALGREVRPITERARRAAGSTDMGNVSLRIPSIHPMIGLGRDAGVIHGEAFAKAAGSVVGDRAVIDGAIALAHTIVDATLDPAIREHLDHPAVP